MKLKISIPPSQGSLLILFMQMNFSCSPFQVLNPPLVCLSKNCKTCTNIERKIKSISTCNLFKQWHYKAFIFVWTLVFFFKYAGTCITSCSIYRFFKIHLESQGFFHPVNKLIKATISSLKWFTLDVHSVHTLNIDLGVNYVALCWAHVGFSIKLHLSSHKNVVCMKQRKLFCDRLRKYIQFLHLKRLINVLSLMKPENFQEIHVARWRCRFMIF